MTQQVRVAAIQAEPRWLDLAAGVDQSPLRDGVTRLGTQLVPADLTQSTICRSSSRACELLITQLERGDERDKVALESLWVSALSSHAQWFRPRANAGWVSR